MEFKGTKGKWVSNYSNGSWLIQDLESYQYGCNSSIAEVYYFHDDKHTAEANALLISKSPEMLEMLQWFVENFEGVFHEGTETDNKVKEVKQLIKQATEL